MPFVLQMGTGNEQPEGSDLDDHVRVKGGLRSPLNAALGDALDISQWVTERLPEYLWWDALHELEGFKGIQRGRDVVDLIKAKVGDDKPFLGYCSEFSEVRDDLREELAPKIQEILGDTTEVLAGVVGLYEDHPMGWIFDGVDGCSAEEAEAFLDEQVSRLWHRRSPGAVNAQHIVIAELARSGKLVLPYGEMGEEIADLLVKYPDVEDHDKAAATICSMTMTIHMTQELDLSWPAIFWYSNRARSPCHIPIIRYGDYFLPQSEAGARDERAVQMVPLLRGRISSLMGAALEGEIDKDVAESVLAVASRCVRIAEDIAASPTLRSPPWLHAGLRMLADHVITARFIAQEGPEIARKYKEYGRGREKLSYKHLQDVIARAPVEAREELERRIEKLREEANLEMSEMFVDIRWDDWSGKNARERADEVGKMDLYRLIFSPMSDIVHCTWDSAKRYDLSMCFNPTHGGHFIPVRKPATSEAPVSFAVGLVDELITHLESEWGVMEEE